MSHPSISSAAPPLKKVCHTPSTTISHLPPQDPTGPEVSDPADQAMESASPAALPASEEVIPANMQPLCIQLGASSGFIGARLRAAKRVHQPHEPPSGHMCTRCTWEWGWCAPPATNPFSTQTHSSATKRVILICKCGGCLSLGNCQNGGMG